ncbi:MAG: MarR family transcriptional regulator [Pirellulaceae bacterium]
MKKQPIPSCDVLPDEIVRALRRILRKVNEHSRQLSSVGDLSISELLCLRHVSTSTKNFRVTSVEIAKAVCLSSPTVSRILDKLERDELILRERSGEDRRKVFVSLTSQGRKRVAKLPPPLQEDFISRLNQISRKEQWRILETLHLVVELMGASELDASPILSPEVVSHSSKPKGKQRNMKQA